MAPSFGALAPVPRPPFRVRRSCAFRYGRARVLSGARAPVEGQS